MIGKFAVLALVICSVYASKPAKGFDAKTSLAEIDNHHIGRTFLNAVQIGITTGSPVHEVQSYINNIRSHLEKEQKDADSYISATQSSCEKLLHDFQTNYNYHSSQLKVHQRIVEDNNNNLQRALNKIAEVSVEIEENAQKQTDGADERELQHEDFKEKQSEHAEAIAAIDEAYALTEHLQGGASFIQVKGRFNKVISRLQSQQQRGSNLIFQPILTLMTQLASRADQEATKKVLQLLSNLRVQIVESKSQDESIEEQQSNNWAKFSSDLVNERNTLQDQRQNLEQSILNYQAIIEESSNKAEYHSEETERNKENLELQEQWCSAQEDLYNLETQQRAQALDLIARISDHIQDKIVTFKEYMKERLVE